MSNWDRLGEGDPQGLLLTLLNTDQKQIEVVAAILDAQPVSNAGNDGDRKGKGW